MTVAQFGGLLVIYFLSLALVMSLTYREFRRVRFNFNIFFSVLYLLTFYLGFPFTCLLVFRYGVEVMPVKNLLKALLAATAFYGIYYVSYKTRLFARPHGLRPLCCSISRTEIHLLWLMLALIAGTTVMVFFIHNDFLLFRLRASSQIFSRNVSGGALKCFFISSSPRFC